STDTIIDTASTAAVLTTNGAVGTIDATAMAGSYDSSADHDWYAVSLTASHTYAFTAKGISGTLNDVAIDLRDANRNILNASGAAVDSGPGGTASFTYAA